MNISANFVVLILILIAGIISGSFALPTKHVAKWRFENIWLQYSLWAFVILPWVMYA
jgi:L-rhamnose-H+ transport protein